MKKIIIALLLAPLFVGAQSGWELGIGTGGWMYMGDVAPSRLPVLRETQPGAGAILRRRIGKTFALRASFQSGKLSGSDTNISDKNIRNIREISFESRLSEVGMLLEWEPFAAMRYPGQFQFRKIISPYVFAGGAWFRNKLGADYSASPDGGMWEKIRQDQSAEVPLHHFTLPFGGGVHLDLSKRSMLSVEVGARPAKNDFLDGVSNAGNPKRNDWYAFAGITYNYRFTPKDRDRDQIPDKVDLCPAIPGVLSAMGCPDADGDGLEDIEDMCPKQPGPRAANGCPDADGDTLPDHLDDCPLEAGPEVTKGCPDADEDTIADKDDACPFATGLLQFKGCPDTDGDGIPDPDDECPEEPGIPEKQGCPYRDSDGDGIFDDFDECPDLAGPEALKGCPDTDGDGIADKADLCPNNAGIPELKGCPVIPEEKKKVFVAARWGVEFETGSAILKPKSAVLLDQIAALLIEFPAYHLQVSGHTDSRGDAAKNLVLSEKRAKSCVDYLIRGEVVADRLRWQGFGKSHPVASNKTDAGRRRNRRVEFDLVVPEE